MLPKKKWIPIGICILILQLILEGIAFWKFSNLGMIPNKYLLIIGIVLIVLLSISVLLLFAGTGNGPTKKRQRRRIIAAILAMFVSTGAIFATSAFNTVDETVQSITSASHSIKAVVGVYVLSSDTSQSLSEIAGYTFGYMENVDKENTDLAIQQLEDLIGSKIRTVSRPGVAENFTALYKKQVKAVIVNEGFIDILSDNPDFSDFDSKVRLLYEVPIEDTEEAEENVLEDSSSLIFDSDSSSSNNASKANKKSDNTARLLSKETITKEPFILYVSGSDTRSSFLQTSRSDVNILMVVNPKTKQILLLNTPRDYYVPNPSGGGAYDKLTHCGIYGIKCSIQALEDLYGCNIDYYGLINFTGFKTLIDTIGGIDVEAPQAFSAWGYDFNEGVNHLNGDMALAFSRERYSFASGDNERGRNQMRVISAVIDKISSSGPELLMKYDSILKSLEGMVSINVRSDELAALVKMQLDKPGQWDIRTYAVTGPGGTDTTYSMPSTPCYVMYSDPEMVKHASELIADVFSGQKLTDNDLL